MTRVVLFILALALPATLLAQSVETKWSRTFPGEANSIRLLPDGGVIVAGGISLAGAHRAYGFATRLSATGDTLWDAHLWPND